MKLGIALVTKVIVIILAELDSLILTCAASLLLLIPSHFNFYLERNYVSE